MPDVEYDGPYGVDPDSYRDTDDPMHPDYEDGLGIEDYRQQVLGEQPAVMAALAGQWDRMGALLRDSRTVLEHATLSLDFEAPTARDVFLSKVGHLVRNLDDGVVSADGVAGALRGLAASAEQRQEEMVELYEEYKTALSEAQRNDEYLDKYASGAVPGALVASMLGVETAKEVKQRFDTAAENLVLRMAADYEPYLSLMRSSLPRTFDAINAIMHPGAFGMPPPPGGYGGPPPAPPSFGGGAPPAPPPFASAAPPAPTFTGGAPTGATGVGGAPTFAGARGLGGPPAFGAGNGVSTGAGQAPGLGAGGGGAQGQGGLPSDGEGAGGAVGGVPQFAGAGIAPGAGQFAGSGTRDQGGSLGARGAGELGGAGDAGSPGFGDAVGDPSGIPAPGGSTSGPTAPTGLVPPAFQPAPGLTPPGVPSAPSALPPAAPPLTSAPRMPSASPPRSPSLPAEPAPPNVSTTPPVVDTPLDPQNNTNLPLDTMEFPPGTMLPPGMMSAMSSAAVGQQQQGKTIGAPGRQRQDGDASVGRSATEDAFQSPGGAVGSPVIGQNGRRTRPGGSAEAPTRGPSSSSGGAPPVLSNHRRSGPVQTDMERLKEERRARRAQRQRNQELRTSEFVAGVESGTSPVFEGRVGGERVNGRMTEVPTALRPATSRPGRPERRVKPQVQADQSARQVVSQPVSHEEQPRVVADEAAWEVQTPGGPVVSARRQEQERRQAEPPPTFGAAN